MYICNTLKLYNINTILYLKFLFGILFYKILELFYIPIKLMNSYTRKSIHDYYKIY